MKTLLITLGILMILTIATTLVFSARNDAFNDPGAPAYYTHWDRANKKLNATYCKDNWQVAAFRDDNGTFDHCFYW